MTTMFVALGAVSYEALGNEVAQYPNVLSYIPLIWAGHSAKAEAIILLMNSLLVVKVLFTQPVYVDLALEYYEEWLLRHGRNCWQRITMMCRRNPSHANSSSNSTSAGTKLCKISIYSTYFILSVLISVMVRMFMKEEAIAKYLPWETTIFALSEIYLFPSTFFLLILWRYHVQFTSVFFTQSVMKFVLSWAIFGNCLYFSITHVS